ncbi:NAD(P)H-hydrate epimerase [Pseudotabrizicola alkalilacus]|uniref:Bifunctional NAD(P)H-hydrate repair enzyme n=2 Tax=Pseudotabrizicola alkalilacus TaxID=2305252 RepID=A0A411Z4L5_9RHOB|nr:NAD(P)H-hydrate epimerase [Pseudotabrizicola alkalilacus]
MRAIEAAAIASGAVTGLELMERAGRGVVEAVFEEWPELRATSHRAVVLCGPGNNGGDGFVVARLLRERGWAVEVFLYGDAERLPPDARVNYERWCGMGVVTALESESFPRLHSVHADLIVDALFGTGFARPADGDAAQVLVHIRTAIWPVERSFRSAEHLVAVDVPTGLCADSGKVIVAEVAKLAHFRADLTVTFHRAKIGHFLEDGPELVGKLVVKDIGLPGAGPAGGRVGLVTPRLESLRKHSGHKYSHGHALILSGPAGRGGAARLAARGALRIGAGVVTVGCPAEAVAEHAGRLDAVMLREVADGDGLAAVLEDGRINALCLGPGLGLDARAAGLVGVALGVSAARPPPPAPPHEGEGRRSGQGGALDGDGLPLPLVGRGQGWGARRVVLDADALTLIAGDVALFGALHAACVLTPHAGEFARLFPDIAAKLAAPATTGPAYSRVDAARAAAARAGCVVLLKGPDTVIAAPDGRCAVNAAVYDRAAPWLATAGAGDVLAGVICGLLARGFEAFDAACTGAWLHVECARSFGPGLIAEDLPEELPKVFRALGL